MGRYKSLIEIPKDALDKWNIIRREEDAREISERAGVTRQLVYLAFNTGKCQQYLLDIMTAYYEERLEIIQERLSDYAD
jgi:AcrR family transcriptional regulator